MDNPKHDSPISTAAQVVRGLLCILTGLYGMGSRIISPAILLSCLMVMLIGATTATAQVQTGLPLGRSSSSYYQVQQGKSAAYQSIKASRPTKDQRFVAGQKSGSKPNTASIMVTQRDTIQLDPRYGFYDDFANSLYTVDTTKWVKRSGTYVNNTYAIGQPNFQVVTFDGLSAGGTPYDSIRVGIAGYGDTLTSLPLDLINFPLRQADSLYLSFDYQVGGPAVQLMPELFDSLNLYFKAPQDTNWIKVWHALGDTVPLTGAKSFKRGILKVGVDWQTYGFQFRFVNYGSRNGTGDIFNIDNVYLNIGRDTNDNGSRRFRDIAAIKATPYLFYPYTALPRSHLGRLCPTNLRDTIKATFGNQNNYTSTAQEVPYTIRATITDSSSGRQLALVEDPFVLTSEFPILGYFNFLRPFRVPEVRVSIGLPTAGLDTLKVVLSRPDTAETTLITTFTLPDQDPQNNPYRRNDTISTRTILSNYYAYDDGSAELVRWTGGNNARMAQAYKLCVRDSLRGIQMLFPKTLQNVFPGRTITFNLYVWPRLLPIRTNIPDRFYINLGVNITPAMVRNGYTNIPFLKPVMIDTGNYYIGWQQGVGIENEVRVGVDLDTEPGNKVWYNFNGNWQLDTTDKHPLCIRPVFGKARRTVTNLPNAISTTLVVAYPNPINAQAGSINLSGYWQTAIWYDITGKVISSVAAQQDEISVPLPVGIRPGIYLLAVRNNERNQTIRVVVQ